MPGLTSVFDAYERRARFYPILIVLMPALLGMASWMPGGLDLPGLAGSALVGVALAAFLSQIARDEGKRKEPSLFRVWGGKPSVRALSYAAGVLDPATLERIHRRLRELDSTLQFPESAETEARDHASAMPTYESANELLLSRTRDRERFRLVFEENVNYGYRRNLWAMKPVGVLTASLGLLAGVSRVAVQSVHEQPVTATALCATALGAVLLVLWWARMGSDWVRVAADAYAIQLVRAGQSL